MSYEIRNHLKDHVTKVRLDEETDELLQCLARFHRTQKAVLARELLESSLREMLANLGANGTADVNAA